MHGDAQLEPAGLSLAGRFDNSEYGRSKKAGEDLFLDNSKETGTKVFVYRFPNLFNKWCRPNYNSAVATFCNAFANDQSYTVDDPSVEIELLYIYDIFDEMMAVCDQRMDDILTCRAPTIPHDEVMRRMSEEYGLVL